jgi:hypothetical protein
MIPLKADQWDGMNLWGLSGYSKDDMLRICLPLVLVSGMTFGNGSQLRTSLELIVSLLAAIGLVRLIRMLHRALQEKPR